MHFNGHVAQRPEFRVPTAVPLGFERRQQFGCSPAYLATAAAEASGYAAFAVDAVSVVLAAGA